jgi:hypothetical protein
MMRLNPSISLDAVFSAAGSQIHVISHQEQEEEKREEK